MNSTTFKRPAFVDLPAGNHDLTFRVIRARQSRETSFKKEVSLQQGDIFMALCEPVQPNVFYRKSPEEDTWRIGLAEPVSQR